MEIYDYYKTKSESFILTMRNLKVLNLLYYQQMLMCFILTMRNLKNFFCSIKISY